MALTKRGKMSRRVRKIWLSLLAALLGTGGLTGLVVWREVATDTDLHDASADITASAKNQTDLQTPPIRFLDVARSMGITSRHGPGKRSRRLPQDTGSGLAWGDYDADGDWDLYVVNFPAPPGSGAGSEDTRMVDSNRAVPHEVDPSGAEPHGSGSTTDGANRLYRNDGDRFTDITEEAGVADAHGIGMGASFADYDSDGDLDLYVTNWGPNRLFRNRGDGSFEEVAARAGVADLLWSTGVAWGDFNRDGHLDLYVCNYVDYDVTELDVARLPETPFGEHLVPFTLNPNSFDPVPNRLYVNRGDGTFREMGEAYGVVNLEGRSLSATFCDLDGDGWLDLYINNDVSTNKLYRNMLGDFQRQSPVAPVPFADLSAITGTADPRGSMGLSIGEIGHMTGQPDGLPDMFITHWVAQENALYQSLRMPGGNLEYRDKTRQFRLGEISIDTVGWGTAMVDLDLDGRVDLVVANGSTLERPEDLSRLIEEPLFLFWNSGRRFVNVAPRAGKAASALHSARGLAAADFDNDGDVDLAVLVNRSEPLLLRNETPSTGRFLKVSLGGAPAACFGATVQITMKGPLQEAEAQKKWYGSDVSFLSMHAPELVFGLGAVEVVERLVVQWADGRQSALQDVQHGRIEVVHPDLEQSDAAAIAPDETDDRTGQSPAGEDLL